MSEIERIDKSWHPCPQGQLTNIAVRLQASDQHSRRNASLRMAAGMLLLLAVGSTFTGLLWRKPLHAGISCQQCVAQFETLEAQLRDGESPMSRKALAAMQTHLRECGLCGQKFQRRYPQAARLLDAAGAAMLLAPHPVAAAISIPTFELFQ